MNKLLTQGSLSPLLFACLANTILSSQAWATPPADNQANTHIIPRTTIVTSTPGLIAHWPLDENTGTIAEDRSGHHHSGVLKNNPIWFENWLNFDGNNDYVDVGTLDVAGKSLTLSAWFRTDQLNNCAFRACRIITKGTGVNEQEHYWLVSTVRYGKKTRLRFRLKTKGVTATLIANSGDLVEGQLTHVAAVYDGNEMRLYKDGVEVGHRAKTGAITTDPTVPVWIGGNPPKAESRSWQGRIGDVRIYNRALTHQEIQTAASSSSSQSGDYALFFEQFLDKKYHLAQLELDTDNPPLINPVEISMGDFNAELGNPDVSFDGKTIVFPALVDDDWNIYRGDLDVANTAITHIEPLVAVQGVREEDPRISWDGKEVIYKCDGDICITDLENPGSGSLVVSNPCELYGPAINYDGTALAYTQRCTEADRDRVVVYDFSTGRELELDSEGHGADRFPHFLEDGSLIYSHLDDEVNTVSLWKYDLYGSNGPLGLPVAFHSSGSVSDDDSYAHKQNPEYLFFLGFNVQTDLYDLYVYRETTGDSVRLSENQPMLGTVVFRYDGL